MNLAWTVEYVVQTGWARIVIVEWLFPLTGLGATESGIDCRAFGTITVFTTQVFVASWFVVVVSGF